MGAILGQGAARSGTRGWFARADMAATAERSGARHPLPCVDPAASYRDPGQKISRVRAYNPSTDLIIEDFMPYREAMARVV